MKKKLLVMTAILALAVGSLAGCGEKQGSDKKEGNKDGYTIGISQFAEHPSLDNCRKGFLEGLKEVGIEEGKNLKITYQNAQADTSTAGTIADSFVSSKVDMICAIATPSASSAYNASMDSGIPVVYTAISDPAAVGLANKDGSSIGNITGSSDVLPVKDQLMMIRELMPEAKTIGILYTTSEENSLSTIKVYKEEAKALGFEIKDVGINVQADVELAATDLVKKVDCISNLTDNTVVSALQTVLDKANEAKIPVFGSEVEQVKNGCAASMGIDYVALGKETGKMAAKILKGESKAEDMDYVSASKSEFYVNEKVLKSLNIEIPEERMSTAAEVFK